MDNLIKQKIDACFSFVADKLFCKKTQLIYDHVVFGREHEFPTAKEILSNNPNPCGYSTGMEDCMISGTTMLDACLLKYQLRPTSNLLEFIRSIVDGMISCALSANTMGFLPRGICIEDGKTHYPDSSRDQYTMFIFAMHKYLASNLYSPYQLEKIKRVITNVAKRAFNNVTKQNDYDMLADNGYKTVSNVMWGDSLYNHEFLRLPMIYIVAYKISGDRFWLDQYLQIREQAFNKSLPMLDYWALYTLQQMQASVYVCYELEEDTEWKNKYLSLMHVIADYVEGNSEKIKTKALSHNNYNAKQIDFRKEQSKQDPRFIKLGYTNSMQILRPDAMDYFSLQDCAQASIIVNIVPNKNATEKVVNLFKMGLEKIDLSVHERNLPVYFINAYYSYLAKQTNNI